VQYVVCPQFEKAKVYPGSFAPPHIFLILAQNHFIDF
jgi:hypothetical protein